MKITIILAALIFPTLSYAGQNVSTMRCGNNLVVLGDSMRDVKNKCGNPTEVTGKHKSDWHYDFGANEFTYVLSFVRGKLTRIYNTDNWGKNR